MMAHPLATVRTPSTYKTTTSNFFSFTCCSELHLPSAVISKKLGHTCDHYHQTNKLTVCQVGRHFRHALPVWKVISNKLAVVASCSSSRESCQTTSVGESLDLEDHNLGKLPGMQSERYSAVETTHRETAFIDMLVNQMIEKETGVDRLRHMYALGPDWMFVEEHSRTVTKMFYRTVLFGVFLHSIKSAQSVAARKKEMGKVKIGITMSEPSDSRRILRDTMRGTFRLSFFAGSILYLSQSIAAYRNVSSNWEYAISGGVAMVASVIGQPPLTFASGVLAGAVAGYFCGGMVCSMLSNAGFSQEQRTLTRIRQQLEQQQLNQRNHTKELML